MSDVERMLRVEIIERENDWLVDGRISAATVAQAKAEATEIAKNLARDVEMNVSFLITWRANTREGASAVRDQFPGIFVRSDRK